jgi:hypothetical protein
MRCAALACAAFVLQTLSKSDAPAFGLAVVAVGALADGEVCVSFLHSKNGKQYLSFPATWVPAA